MKHTKKIKPKVTPIPIFCGCILFCALSFCVKETAGAAENVTEESGETVLKISETAGTPGKDGAVLTKVRQQYTVSFPESTPVQFVFDDGTAVEWTSIYALYELKNAECLDVTGDGVKEVLLWGYYVNTATEYNMLNIFQIDGREVTELRFWDDIEELRDEACNTNLFYMNRGDKKGYALQVETYGKEGAQVFLEQQMEIYYENGKWRKLPGRELKPQVSLESHSEAAKIYEAFLRGECNAGELERCRYAADYCHLGLKDYEDFSFQDVLDGILADSRETHCYTPAVHVEDMECGLIDCVESVEYGLIDCGEDGRPELAVRVRGVHEYFIDEDCDVILIFGCRNGKVKLLYEVDTWENRHAEICLDGSIYTDGKGKIYCDQNDEWSFDVRAEGETEDGCLECAGIGSDYLYSKAYEVFVGSGKEVGGMTAYEPLCGEELFAEFYQCVIDDKMIYAYRMSEDVPGDVLEHIYDYIAENEDELGIKFFSYETMQALCDAQERKIGIAGDDSEENKIQWQTLQGCEEYLVCHDTK